MEIIKYIQNYNTLKFESLKWRFNPWGVFFDTEVVDEGEVSDDVATLPEIKGQGWVKSLSLAMSEDESLREVA